MAHEAVTVEQAGAAVVLGEEVHPVAGVGEGRGDLGTDHVAVHDRVVEQVVHRELAGDLLARTAVVGGQEAGVESDRAVRRHRSDGVEHVLAVLRMQVVEDRPTADQLGVVAEQTGDRPVDRTDRARLVGEHDHPVHVRHHRTEHAGVALVEVETVPVGDVAGDDHDRRIGTVGAIGRLRLGATDLEIDPGATAGPGAERDQVAEGLRADGLERRLGERQIGRMDEIEHRGADEVARIPVEYLARPPHSRTGGCHRSRSRGPDHRGHRVMARQDRPSRTESARQGPRCAIGLSRRVF